MPHDQAPSGLHCVYGSRRGSILGSCNPGCAFHGAVSNPLSLFVVAEKEKDDTSRISLATCRALEHIAKATQAIAEAHEPNADKGIKLGRARGHLKAAVSVLSAIIPELT